MDPDVMDAEMETRRTSATRRPVRQVQRAKGDAPAATAVAPLLEGLFGNHMPVRFELWDGSGLGPSDGPGTLVIRTPNAISRMLWAPGELGIGRAYVTGELEADGDIFSLLQALHVAARPDLRAGPCPTGCPWETPGPSGGGGLAPWPTTLQTTRRRGDQPSLRHQQRVLPS